MDVRTGDLISSPFADQSFDVVTAAMAIHNIGSSELGCAPSTRLSECYAAAVDF